MRECMTYYALRHFQDLSDLTVCKNNLNAENSVLIAERKNSISDDFRDSKRYHRDWFRFIVKTWRKKPLRRSMY